MTVFELVLQSFDPSPQNFRTAAPSGMLPRLLLLLDFSFHPAVQLVESNGGHKDGATHPRVLQTILWPETR